MRSGKINFNGNGVIEVFYQLVSNDEIQFVVPSGEWYYTHYKSLIV